MTEEEKENQVTCKADAAGSWWQSLPSSLLPHGPSQQQCSQRVLGSSCLQKPTTKPQFPEWGTVGPSATGCESQAALILGTDHMLTLRKQCAIRDCAMENPGETRAAYPQPAR